VIMARGAPCPGGPLTRPKNPSASPPEAQHPTHTGLEDEGSSFDASILLYFFCFEFLIDQLPDLFR
jgi:hypothetical protein